MQARAFAASNLDAGPAVMKQKIESRYAVPAQVVMRAFADPAFHLAKLDGLGLKKYRVLEQHSSAQQFRIRIERKVPMQAPALVKKVVPSETTAVSEERWELGTRKGRVIVEPGVPVDMSCEAGIDELGAECVVRYEWEVRAKVPLIGGALEKFILADMVAKMNDETRVAAALMERYRSA